MSLSNIYNQELRISLHYKNNLNFSIVCIQNNSLRDFSYKYNNKFWIQLSVGKNVEKTLRFLFFKTGAVRLSAHLDRKGYFVGLCSIFINL
jgi:hypothetical protein